MKKMIALLLSLLYSMFSNVEYQPVDDVPFDYQGYYIITDTQAPDYRALYSTGAVLSLSDSCFNTQVAVDNLVTIQSEQNTDNYAYWVAPVEVSLNDIANFGTMYTFEEDTEVAIPRKATIVTHAYASNSGHYMELVTLDGNYRFVFNNLERWYCCRTREATENWEHTIDVFGTDLSDGNLVGYATPETTFQVQKLNQETGLFEVIDLYSFYNR